jgi:hypothetical protein
MNEINKMTENYLNVAKTLFDRFLEKPSVSAESEEHIPFNKEEAKAKKAGEQEGYSKGHDLGFAKGMVVGMVAAAAAVFSILR